MKSISCIILFIFSIVSCANALSGDAFFLNTPSGNIIKGSRLYVAHSFFGDIARDSFLGIDAGANVDLGFGMRLGSNFDANFVRSRMNKEYNIYGKFNILNQQTFRLTFLAGGTYKSESSITTNKSSYLAQLILNKSFFNDNMTFGLTPTFATGTRVNDPAEPSDTAAIGMAASFSKELDFYYFERLELIAEYVMNVYGYSLTYPTNSFGIKLKTWGHYFTLLTSNSSSALPNSYIVGTNNPHYHFGFNIAREF